MPVLAKSLSSGRIFKFSAALVKAALAREQPKSPPPSNPPGLKRSEEEILRDLRHVENDLSPENLSCDGEIPWEQVHPKMQILFERKKQLEQELGRSPTAEEMYWEGGLPAR